jgi:hypothetical protein
MGLIAAVRGLMAQQVWLASASERPARLGADEPGVASLPTRTNLVVIFHALGTSALSGAYATVLPAVARCVAPLKDGCGAQL